MVADPQHQSSKRDFYLDNIVVHLKFLMLFILTLFVFLQTGIAQTIPLKWMDEPARSDSISISEGEFGVYLNLNDLADRLEIPTSTGKHQNRIRLDFPGEQMIFTVGSPFVMVEGRLEQMPLALKSNSEGFWAPLETLIEFIAQYYPGDLFYDPHRKRLLVSKPIADLLGIRFVRTGPQLQAVITTGRPLTCRVQKGLDNEIEMFFPDGTIDSSRFQEVQVPDGIISVRASQASRGASLFFSLHPEVSFINITTVEDPPANIAVFSSGEPAGSLEDLSNRLLEERDQWDIDVVVIDPGHGGKDPGAVGITGLYEKDVVLEVGLRLREYLEQKGVTTIMTRDRDIFIPLVERTKIANSSGGKLFISLHCNSADDHRANGLEVYFLSPTKTERAMAVAMKENSVVKYEETQEQYAGLAEEAFILLSMTQANFVRESQNLASVVQDQVSDGSNLKNRGVDQAGFYVLIGASMPSVLFEMGFISNREEEQRFKNKKFQKKIAHQCSEAVLQFLEESKANGM